MTEILNVVAVVFAGLIVGNEFAIAAFVHPTLNRLEDRAHLSAASALALLLGRVMPFWYGLVLLLISAAGCVRWHQSDHLPRWIAASAILWVLAIVYSITIEVPINNRVASWTKSSPPAEWKTLRDKWDLHHRCRVALLTIAFAFLTMGVITR